MKVKWEDPNPIKYGGKYGMMNLKEVASETFQMRKAEEKDELEMQRLAALTQQEVEDELEQKEAEMEERKEMVKLENVNEEQDIKLKTTLEVHPRSHLIKQKKTSYKTRVVPMFHAKNKGKDLKKLKGDLSSEDEEQADDKNITFQQSNSTMEKSQAVFGKRSKSMAVPGL